MKLNFVISSSAAFYNTLIKQQKETSDAVITCGPQKELTTASWIEPYKNINDPWRETFYKESVIYTSLIWLFYFNEGI